MHPFKKSRASGAAPLHTYNLHRGEDTHRGFVFQKSRDVSPVSLGSAGKAGVQMVKEGRRHQTVVPKEADTHSRESA